MSDSFLLATSERADESASFVKAFEANCHALHQARLYTWLNDDLAEAETLTYGEMLDRATALCCALRLRWHLGEQGCTCHGACVSVSASAARIHTVSVCARSAARTARVAYGALWHTARCGIRRVTIRRVRQCDWSRYACVGTCGGVIDCRVLPATQATVSV